MRQIPGLQAAWSAGVTAKGAPSSAGALFDSGDAAAAAGAGLTGATARRGAGRRTAPGGAAGAGGVARRVPRRVVALRAVRFGSARCAAAGRWARGAAFFAILDPESSFWARRARFQTLRATAECLRARLAS